MSRIESVVKEALASILQISEPESIKYEQHLRKDLHLDSMGSLMFLMRLEDNLEGFYVDPETLQNTDLETVGSVIQYVDMQLDIQHENIH